MLKACLNGNRTRTEHPALPVTVSEITRDAAAVFAAGADAVHVHVKDAHGADTLAATALGAVLRAVRAAAPGLPVGVTTGAWAVRDAGARVAAIQSWATLPELPDFASVNWHEDGADEVAGALLDLGVGVEAGLWHVAAAEAWAVSPRRDRCLRVLLELPGDLPAESVEDEARRLLEVVDGRLPVLLHGEDSSAWPALVLAGGWGLSTRVGLEDVLWLPDGSKAPDNLALLRAAQALLAR
ncbi:3-keto-5-aminohexanoate cleavage protein [Nocardioides sp.]|uniref:3-keto-5-aminohexanoate cleavage protein n=1 Tax=Nocardioides sp. TaxID=35761 RepID=UPI003D0F3292